MNVDKIKNSFFPNLLFLIGVVYLFFSGLTIEKAITLQNELLVNFMKGLSEKDVMFATLDSLGTLVAQAILPLLPFMILISFGFLSLFLLKEKMDLKIFIGMQYLFLIVLFVLTGLSLVMLFAYIGIVISSMLLIKMFEVEKSNFSTGSSVVSKNLRWINIFLAIGIFLMLYVNFSAYEEMITQENVRLVKNFIPEQDKIQEVQLELVNNTADSILYSMGEKCDQSVDRTECLIIYNAMAAEIEDYKQRVAEEISSGEGGGEELIEEYVTEAFPLLGQITKASPLLLAVTVFALLETLSVFVSMLFGIVYSGGIRFIGSKSRTGQ